MESRKHVRRPNPELREKVKAQIINLIENENVTDFLVGEIGGFEKDAYDAVLDVFAHYPDIHITLVISKISELNEIGKDYSGYIVHKKFCHDWIYPDRCASGYKRWSIVHRNRFIIENTDFIIAYNCYKGRAYKFCRTAERKGIPVIELAGG